MKKHIDNAIKKYVVNVLIGLDQLATALLGGYPDETLSSYAYRLDVQGKRFGFMRAVIDKLFAWQSPHHCLDAYLSERERTQMPAIFRDGQ